MYSIFLNIDRIVFLVSKIIVFMLAEVILNREKTYYLNIYAKITVIH